MLLPLGDFLVDFLLLGGLFIVLLVAKQVEEDQKWELRALSQVDLRRDSDRRAKVQITNTQERVHFQSTSLMVFVGGNICKFSDNGQSSL